MNCNNYAANGMLVCVENFVSDSTDEPERMDQEDVMDPEDSMGTQESTKREIKKKREQKASQMFTFKKK